MSYTIKNVGNGWYNFQDIPQSGYIKVHNIRCSTDRKAINLAKRLIGDKSAKIEVIKVLPDQIHGVYQGKIIAV